MPSPSPRIPEYRALTPEALDALERAVRHHLRVALRRRGTEYVMVAEGLEMSGRDDSLAGRLPMTADFSREEPHEQRDPQDQKENPETEQDLFRAAWA